MEDKITHTVVVIGAVNMDICGRPYAAPNMYDSNPGTVTTAPGGVGRNIAHNLSLLGLNVKFIAAIGNDAYGKSLYDSCLSLGFDMHMCRCMDNFRTSTYMYITDEEGEMQLAVCNTDVADCINPEYLEPLLPEINDADAVVLDGNLSEETLTWIADKVSVPLYADPVSITKSERLVPILGKLRAFKPNVIEALRLTGADSAEDAAKILLEKGIERVFISLGKDGVLAAEKGETMRLPSVAKDIVNTTGAGDAATAAVIWADVKGKRLADCAHAAMRASAVVMAYSEAINPALCEKLISD